MNVTENLMPPDIKNVPLTVVFLFRSGSYKETTGYRELGRNDLPEL